MSNIVILIGISGCGKTTHAHHLWSQDRENVVIVNRDKIREMLFGYSESRVSEYYSLKSLNKTEKEVTKYENLIIQNALNDNKTVVVDATHLKREYIERYKYFNVRTETIIMSISVELAVLRDNNRTRKVGEEVIKKQYAEFQNLIKSLKNNPIAFPVTKIRINEYLKPCVIFDIDGTLAHNVSRNPFDWTKVKEDIEDKAVMNLLTLYDTNGYSIIICSGREASCREETLEWLGENNVERLYMRKVNDYRPDWIVKEEMWREIAHNYNILFLVDDRQQVVDRARSLGLKVFQVEPHNF